MKNILRSSTIALGLFALGSTTVLAQVGPQGGPRGGHERPSFSELDANGDGVITLAEMQNQAQAKFSAADTNGDGQLDASELNAAAARAQARRIERLIARKDTNGDGLLSLAEMGPRDGGGARLFARVDTDGNGEVTQAEWDAAQAHMQANGPRGPQTAPSGN
jgi:hypothetical protein